MGEVYLAQDTQLNRRVALKFPTVKSDEHHAHARFLREARAVSTLSHPHIATIYDYGETPDGKPFIIMEVIKGESLDDLLRTSALSLARAVEIIADVADALAEAHRHGIIHRDIKPSNVMINERGDVKVLDFGLAKQVEEERVSSVDHDAETVLETRTQSGVVVGTLLYLSPEQATGSPVDPRSDIFALGTLLYECITGRPAFSGKNAIEIVAQVIHVTPPPPSSINQHIPPELDRITLKALAKEPVARYQSAADFRTDLLALHHTLEDSANVRTQRIGLAPSTRRSSALTTLSDMLRRPRLSPLIVLIAFVAVGLIVWGIVQWRRPKLHVPTAEAQRLYDTGTDAIRNGSFFQASKALEMAVHLDDQFALAHARLAEAWMEMDYTDKAKDEMLRVSELTPDRSALPPIDSIYLDAITATVRRDFAKAVEHYSKIARQLPDQPYVYVDLGRAYEKNEQTDKAIEQYIAATNRDQLYATAFLRVGILYGRKGQQESAMSSFNKAEEIYQAQGKNEGRTEVLFQRGALLNQLGKVVEAKEQLQQALTLARTAPNLYQQIQALLQLSSVALAGGATEQAKQYATEAINLAQANDAENLTTEGLLNLGYAFFMRRDYGEAEQYFNQALDFAQRYKGKRNEAKAMLYLGSLFIQQEERIDEAMRYIEQALTFYQQGGYRKEVSQALLLRGRVKLQLGDYNGALREFDQQLQIAQQVDDPAQLANSHILIGSSLADEEFYLGALQHFEESYKITKSLGIQLTLGYSLLDRGDMLWRLGRYEEAREALNQVPTIADRIDSNYKQVLIARSYLINAQMALSERRFPEAIAQSQQALTLAGTQIKRAGVEAKYTLGLAQALSGAKHEARQTCEAAVEMAEKESDPRLLSKALLALAEAMLESGDVQGALATAQRAQEHFARAGQQESEWRAWLIEGRASQRMKNTEATHEYFSHAINLLSTLQQKWGEEGYNGYLARPDIQSYRKQLSEASTVVR